MLTMCPGSRSDRCEHEPGHPHEPVDVRLEDASARPPRSTRSNGARPSASPAALTRMSTGPAASTKRSQLAGIGDVERERDVGLEPLDAPRAADHPRALAREHPRGRRADAARGARDDRRHAVEAPTAGSATVTPCGRAGRLRRAWSGVRCDGARRRCVLAVLVVRRSAVIVYVLPFAGRELDREGDRTGRCAIVARG